jgi:alcohol dehydrogenase (cytochrome c)
MTFGMTRHARFLAWTLAAAFAVASFAFGQGTVASYTPLMASDLEAPADGDWLMWRRTYDAWGYSPLDQITPENVGELRLAWAWNMVDGSQQTTPLVYNGIMYLHNTGNRVQALDAATGDLIWQHDRSLPGDLPGIAGATRLRSMSLAHDKLYFASGDMQLVALDPRTGQVIFESSLGAWEERFRPTGGTLVVGDVVVVPISGCGGAQPGGCYIAGMDAHSGEQLWRVNTIAEPGTPEGDTWNNLPWESRFGSSAWNIGSYDPELDLIYFATGQPYPWIAEMSGLWPVQEGASANALYTNTTLAMRPQTGEIVWYHQWLPNDTWDLDYGYEQTLVDLEIDGESVPALVTVGKLGIVEAIDRRDGRFLFAIETIYQNVVASIDPVTGEKTINMETWPAIGQTTVNCPADPGGRSWAATAYSPRTGALYLPMQEFCSDTTPNPLGEGEVYTGGGRATFARRPIPGTDGNMGLVHAVSLTNQEEFWSHRMRSANGGSAAVATGGGLVFTGNLARFFMAFDDTTGEKLWEVRLSNLPNGFPITYTANGKQYVAVPVGRGSGPSNAFAVLTPEIINPPGGSMLYVFALPD